MPVILLTNKYSDKVLAVVRRELPIGFEFISLQSADKNDLIQKAAIADYFLVSGRVSIDKDVIESALKLKMIQRTGVGTDTIDIETLKNKGIPVYVNAGINSISVAEHTIMLILSVLRHLTAVNKSVKTGNWSKNDIGIECNSLHGKTVGIIGIGNIGKTIIKMLQPFGVTILYHDILKLTKQEEIELKIQYCDLPELYKKIDILSLHCPLTPQTNELIGAQEIASMKQGVIIINTARGKLIEETALYNALRSGYVKGAGLDVFSNEPLNNDNPLLNLDNVILTPHIGGLTLETFIKMMRDAFENIKLFQNGNLDLIEDKKLQ